MKIWIDLDNSPHVPFFVPIIEELERRGYTVLITARDCFQVCELADLHNVRYKAIGRHYGKHKILKLFGLILRSLELASSVLRERPHVALSHGSRSQLLLAALLRIPSIVIVDYEFARGLVGIHPSCVMFPEVIPAKPMKSRVLKYPGIKEDVYVPRFKPDSAIMARLGLSSNELVVTLRPPATEAHYHNPESEELLVAVVELLSSRSDTKVVLLPRNQKQEISIRKSWEGLFASGKMMVPDYAVDGLNLIWHSDLVISGGGTMNREAAALGVPVYSIFRGKIGAVDRYLAARGRLVLIESVADVRTKIEIKRRPRPSAPETGNSETLRKIVDNVMTIVESTGSNPLHPWAAGQLPTNLDIHQLNVRAVNGLAPMFNAGKQLFCYKLQQSGASCVQEGLSHRYTIMTLLGLHRSEAAGLGSPVEIRTTLGCLLQDTTWIRNIGDLGLLLWACAVIWPERLRETCLKANLQTTFEQSREVRQGRTMELAWFLSGLAHAGLARPQMAPGLKDLAVKAYQLTKANQGNHGIFGHFAGRTVAVSAARARIGSFADQVYPIYAFTKFAQAFQTQAALESARLCASAICRAQGPLGQWWWHYDASTGKVLQRYPVYAVHQHGMAPMALFALGEATGTDFSEEIYKGLAWINGNNELGSDLRDTSSSLIWRSIYRWNKRTLYFREFLDFLRPNHKLASASDLRIRFECRPYELGWLLNAFAGWGRDSGAAAQPPQVQSPEASS